MTDFDATGALRRSGSPPGRILVGVDGSQSSRAALRWAAAQARLTRLPLLVVHAWTSASYPHLSPLLVRELAEREAWTVLDRAVREGIGDRPEDREGLEITTRLVAGHPARVLASLGRDAAMVVIGAGGHGELAGLLLGSVGLHLAAHAPVPVVTVPRPSPTPPVEEPAAATDETTDGLPVAAGPPEQRATG
jgi:nucleotide-binding universal stress UspA family protein